MADPEQDSQSPQRLPATSPASAQSSLPEFLNPESTHYQPWAEKQIFNAAKEKRSLEEFMADFQARLDGYSGLPQAGWDPQHQDRLLARFTVGAPGRSKRHRRRRGGGQPGPATGARQQAEGGAGRSCRGRPGPAATAGTSPSPPAPGGQSGERRRRRRRSRGGSGAPAGPPPA